MPSEAVTQILLGEAEATGLAVVLTGLGVVLALTVGFLETAGVAAGIVSFVLG
jgi:hypothetical protein